MYIVKHDLPNLFSLQIDIGVKRERDDEYIEAKRKRDEFVEAIKEGIAGKEKFYRESEFWSDRVFGDKVRDAVRMIYENYANKTFKNVLMDIMNDSAAWTIDVPSGGYALSSCNSLSRARHLCTVVANNTKPRDVFVTELIRDPMTLYFMLDFMAQYEKTHVAARNKQDLTTRFDIIITDLGEPGMDVQAPHPHQDTCERTLKDGKRVHRKRYFVDDNSEENFSNFFVYTVCFDNNLRCALNNDCDGNNAVECSTRLYDGVPRILTSYARNAITKSLEENNISVDDVDLWLDYAADMVSSATGTVLHGWSEDQLKGANIQVVEADKNKWTSKHAYRFHKSPSYEKLSKIGGFRFFAAVWPYDSQKIQFTNKKNKSVATETIEYLGYKFDVTFILN
jgi:hypothetical protein